MKHRLPLVLSALALVISLLGAAALGMAASGAQIVPLAKTSNFAKNAGKLNGHKSSIAPRAGQIPVVGATGKLPASLGAVGPEGRSGPCRAARGYQRISQQANLPTGGKNKTYTVTCPGGKSVLARRLRAQQAEVRNRPLGHRVDADLGFGLGVHDAEHDRERTRGYGDVDRRLRGGGQVARCRAATRRRNALGE